MGEIHDLRCNKCGYGIKAMIGIGMLYSSENIFGGTDPLLPELVADKNISEQAFQIIKEGKKISEHYGHELYACPNDDFLFDKFYFKVGDLEPQYTCPYGDGVLQRIRFAKGRPGLLKLEFVDHPELTWHCPRCGNDMMNEVAVGNWD